MSLQIQCTFCHQAFDGANSSGNLRTPCPRCGRQHAVSPLAGNEMKGTEGWSKTVVFLVVLALVVLALAAVYVSRQQLRPSAAGASNRPALEAPALAPVGLTAGPAKVERADVEANKDQAEQVLRQQLDELEPMFKVNETVKLHRKNGVVDQGIFTGLSGTGPGRVAVLATATGEIGVPLVMLDNASRRRMDPLYREAYLKHMLSIGGSPLPAERPVE